MARQSRAIGFSTYGEMASHLDRWARSDLGDPERWTEALRASSWWLDYSARNQLLLASYGAAGPVAGPETWRLVTSTQPGRPCAIRAGEHGYPVRVPVTGAGTEPDPHLGGARRTRAATDDFEWRSVFSLEQLARRPPAEVLEPPGFTAIPSDPARLLAAARHVAAATVRGRLAADDDPASVLADAASRLRRSSNRPKLERASAEQVAWLVLDRIGSAPSADPPAFDPSELTPRQRWETLLDILDPARRLTAAFGAEVGVDITASPLPRMAFDDPPGASRRRLPDSTLERLPIGRWQQVGPYTAAEWGERGEEGSGLGAFLRLNGRAYLAVVEHGDGASWRLEDVDARTGAGQLMRGSATSVDEAKQDAVAAVGGRYPALDPSVGPSKDPSMWSPVAGEGRQTGSVRHVRDGVTLYALPGPGGRWMPSVLTGEEMRRLPLAADEESARQAAEGAARFTLVTSADPAPSLDEQVSGLASSPGYSRQRLVDLVTPRLIGRSADGLAADDPHRLTETMGEAGIDAQATLRVLRAEGLDPTTVAEVMPVLGLTTVEGIAALEEEWGTSKGEAAEALSATASEMRAAGCSAQEIMLSRPRDVLRALPDDPHLWELAAVTMANAGHDEASVASHLVAHAPTPAAFAAGITSAVEDPASGLSTAVDRHATPAQLTAASRGYGLSPETTGRLLLDAGAAADTALDVLEGRCHGDRGRAADLGARIGVGDDDLASWRADVMPPVRHLPGADILGPEETASLLAALPDPDPTPQPPDLIATLDQAP